MGSSSGRSSGSGSGTVTTLGIVVGGSGVTVPRA